MSDFPEKAEDKVNTVAIVTIGLATTAILWAAVVALQAYFENTAGEIAARRAAQGKNAVVRDLKSMQLQEMSTTTYADPNKGTLKRLDFKLAKAAVVKAAKERTPLIPTLGVLNTPTVPAVAGRPADGVTLDGSGSSAATDEPAEATAADDGNAEDGDVEEGEEADAESGESDSGQEAEEGAQ